MLNVFLGYVTSSSKGSCLTALERCTCRCPGCEAQSLGGCFFPWKVYNLHQGGFPKSQGIGGVGSWVVESLARSGIGGSELQRFWVGWLVRRSSNWRNFTFFFSNKIPQRQVQDETSPATITVLLLAVFGGLPWLTWMRFASAIPIANCLSCAIESSQHCSWRWYPTVARHTLSDTVGRAKAICLLQLSPVQPCSCHEAVRSMWWPRGWGPLLDGQSIWESKSVEFRMQAYQPALQDRNSAENSLLCGVVLFAAQLYHGAQWIAQGETPWGKTSLLKRPSATYWTPGHSTCSRLFPKGVRG